MNIDRPDETQREAFSFPYVALGDRVATLAALIGQNELPSRKHVRYSLPIDSSSYVELPPAVRAYANVEDISSCNIDFIQEAADDTTLIKRTALEAPLHSRGCTLILGAAEYNSSLQDSYPVYLERKGEVAQIGSFPAKDITRVLLRSIGYDDSAVDERQLDGVDLLDVEHTDQLEAAVEVYGFRDFALSSYEIDDLVSVTTVYDEANDTNIPNEITICLLKTPFSLSITARDTYEIKILENNIPLIYPEDDIINEMSDMIQSVINQVQKNAGTVEVITDPRFIDGPQ